VSSFGRDDAALWLGEKDGNCNGNGNDNSNRNRNCNCNCEMRGLFAPLRMTQIFVMTLIDVEAYALG
jgi:hypothetical protein